MNDARERAAATRAERGLVGLVALTLGAPALTMVVLAAWVPEEASWPLAAALVLLFALDLWGALFGGRALRGPVVALAVLGGLVLVPEAVLRASGFRHHAAGTVQFGYPRPADFVGLAHDDELFWTLDPHGERVNAQGLVGPDFEIEKPAGTLRLAFLGDSCTWQGYPELAVEALAQDPSAWRGKALGAGGDPKARVEAVNLAVPGYTSFQGKVQAARWIPRLAPDVGVVLFGWNDHWRAYGAIDSEKRVARSSLARVLERSRLAQWITSRAPRPDAEPLDLPRVPLEEYRANLAAIAGTIEEVGGRVILVTAPSAHPRRGVPEYLLARGFVADGESVIDLHARYNDAVRALAEERRWRLADCERLLADDPAADSYFQKDGIHFTEAGARWMGSCVAAAIRDELAER